MPGRVSLGRRRDPGSRRGRLVRLVATGLAAAWGVGCAGESRESGAPPADPLRSVASFDEIPDEVERSKAIFVEAGRVLQHPRCLNCHPVDPHPRQGARLAMHEPPVVAGLDGRGASAMRCETCHQEANVEFAGVPGHPAWHLAPREMGWIGLSLGEICEQVKDPARNGGMGLEALREHMAEDSLVGWAWDPGPGLEPAPGTQASFGRLFEAWIEAGAHCPDGDAGARVVEAPAGADCAACHERFAAAD